MINPLTILNPLIVGGVAQDRLVIACYTQKGCIIIFIVYIEPTGSSHSVIAATMFWALLASFQ